MKGQAFNVGLSSANLTKRELAEKIKEHIFFGIRLSEGEDILCFGAEWLGTEDIYFFLENYND